VSLTGSSETQRFCRMLSLPQEARKLGADLVLHRDAPLGASRAWDRKDNTPSHGLLRCRELMQETAPPAWTC